MPNPLARLLCRALPQQAGSLKARRIAANIAKLSELLPRLTMLNRVHKAPWTAPWTNRTPNAIKSTQSGKSSTAITLCKAIPVPIWNQINPDQDIAVEQVVDGNGGKGSFQFWCRKYLTGKSTD